MKRNAKDLQDKSKAHQVRPTGHGTWLVTSASSGKEYRVFELAYGLRCTCEWSDHYPDRACSHTLRVEQWLAITRSLSYWPTQADAKRQHRPITRLGHGLWATGRLTQKGLK